MTHYFTPEQCERIRTIASFMLADSRMTRSQGYNPLTALKEAAKAVRDIAQLPIADVEDVPGPYVKIDELEQREQKLLKWMDDACRVLREHARFPTNDGVTAVQDLYKRAGRDECGH